MPKNLDYTLAAEGDVQNLTVYKRPNYDEPFVADNSHAQWEKILQGVLADDVGAIDLFNIANTLKRELISERVAVANGRLYFDGDEVHDGLAALVVKMISEGNPQYPAFVKLLEKVYSNPQQHSREHLYGHIEKYSMTITPDGDLVLYKGVYPSETEFDGVTKRYVSGHAGPAIVNGLQHESGRVPQDVGDIVELPRSETWTNPAVACSTGLHIAPWGFWGNYPMYLAVVVNPRDVVSVPHNDSKIRCCRYKIAEVVTGPYTGTVVDVKVPAPKVATPIEVKITLKPKSVGVIPVAKVKHPTQAQVDNAFYTAKRQRKGIVNYATNRLKWRLIEGDGSKRKHWSTV